jgi:hypothetical protein
VTDLAAVLEEPDDETASAIFAQPWRPMLSRGDVVPAFDAIGPVRVALLADLAQLLAAVDSGRAPRGPAPMPRYHERPDPRAVEVTPAVLPAVPDLMPGIDAPELGAADDYLPGRGEAVAWDDDSP